MKDESNDVEVLRTALEKSRREWHADQVLLKSYADTIAVERESLAKTASERDELRKTVSYWKARCESADRLLASYRAAAKGNPDGT